MFLKETPFHGSTALQNTCKKPSTRSKNRYYMLSPLADIISECYSSYKKVDMICAEMFPGYIMFLRASAWANLVSAREHNE